MSVGRRWLHFPGMSRWLLMVRDLSMATVSFFLGDSNEKIGGKLALNEDRFVNVELLISDQKLLFLDKRIGGVESLSIVANTEFKSSFPKLTLMLGKLSKDSIRESSRAASGFFSFDSDHII